MRQGRAAPRRLVKGAKAKNKSTKGAGAARRAVFAGKDQRPFPVCGGCDARRYCGEACQIADWEAGHARKCG